MITPVQAALVWQPHLPAVACAALIAALAGWNVLLYRRMRTRMSPRKAWLLMTPRVILLFLLVIALLDPRWSTRHHTPDARHLLVLRDVSASMQVQDTAAPPRHQRAAGILERLQERFPDGVKTLEFDTRLREPGSAHEEATPGTDLAGCLLALEAEVDLSACSAIVLLTDGGDARVDTARLPPVPLSVVGIGAAEPELFDMAVTDVQAPDSVETGVDFDIKTDIQAWSPATVAHDLPVRPPVSLEIREGSRWVEVERADADLSRQRVRLTFTARRDEPGVARFRLRLEPRASEMSDLNNTRTFSVEVREKSLHVLYFTREVGTQMKMIRSELASDPGITFTALFRTIGERFTIQGERLEGDEDLGAGFPEAREAIDRYDVIMLGSFPADDWTAAQTDTLIAYVQAGGAVVFLGGPHSYAQGGYNDTDIADLVPWELRPAGEGMLRGAYAVSLPVTALHHPVVSGMEDLLLEEAQATLESVNPVGALKPAAVGLLHAGVGDRLMAVVALQPYGQGRVLSLATNTLWKWARQTAALRRAFGIFWRQAVRHLAGAGHEGDLLSVKWSKPAYRKGEQAEALIKVPRSHLSPALRLAATLHSDDRGRAVPVDPVPGHARAFAAKALLTGQGTQHFVLHAYDGDTLIESYEKHIPVIPLPGEGTRLYLDTAFLQSLAQHGSGMYVHESEVENLLEYLTTFRRGETMVSETSLVREHLVFAFLFLGVLVGEWVLRRRLNLF